MPVKPIKKQHMNNDLVFHKQIGATLYQR